MTEVTIKKGVISYDVDGIFYHKSFAAEGVSAIPHGRVECRASRASGGELQVGVTLIPDKNILFSMHSCSLYASYDGPVGSVFSNGYQSWTESREYTPRETQKQMSKVFNHWIRKYHLRTYGDEHMSIPQPPEGVISSYTWTCLTGSSETMTLLGSTSEQYGFTIFQVDTKGFEIVVRKECEGAHISQKSELLSLLSITGSAGTCYGSWERGFRKHSEPVPPAVGWTSWYNYYEKISSEIILENVRAFSSRSVPIDYIQVDDGWQQAVGDWLMVKNTFPDGMKPVAAKIRKEGYDPGLWLAPFVAEESSTICEKHADWLVRDEQGSFIIAGYNPFNWSGNFYVLDIYHHDVREYLRQVFHMISSDWGFRMVKLDFLYAEAIIPRNGRSRGQIMVESMRFLREIAGPLRILGCGVPLGAAFGYVDYCRIGSDVSLGWEDLRLKMVRYKERVSTVNSLVSTIGRAQLNNRFFNNDPDVFILRDENTSLTAEQKQTLFLLNNLLGSLVFTSDCIDTYREETLSQYLSSFPMRKKEIHAITHERDCYRITASIDGKAYCVLANLSPMQRSARVPEQGTYWFESTLSEECVLHPAGEEITLRGYSSICLYQADTAPWGVVGTTGRLFPASEIHSHYVIDERDGVTFNVYIELESRIPAKGLVFLNVADGQKIGQIYLHGQEAQVIRSGDLTIARFSMEELYDS